MSSQLYMPHYLAIRDEVPCKAPAQRRRGAILAGAVGGRLLGAKIGAKGLGRALSGDGRADMDTAFRVGRVSYRCMYVLPPMG